nr:UDP-glucuronosyltransferase 1-6-like [Lytechinus pictus]
MEVSVFYQLLFLSLCQKFVSGHNFLMNAIFGEGSHFLCSAYVGERLVQQGHNVTFLISNAYAHRANDTKFSHFFHFEIFQHADSVEAVHDLYDRLSNRVFKSHMKSTGIMTEGPVADCEALLADDDIMSRLRSANFTAVIYDITWLCPLLIAKHLDIPYITQSALSSPCRITGWSTTPFSLASIPVPRTGLSNKMNFVGRMVNLFSHIRMQFFYEFSFRQYENIKNKYNIAPHASIPQLVAQTELFLVNTDFSVEFPCALPPNVIPVGGLTTRPSNQLPSDIEDFVQSSGNHGVIVCTTGTYLTSIPAHALEHLLNAFGRLPQNVIFQLRNISSGINLPSNVYSLPWVPQNDLLGHPKTRALLFHGGNNGFYEAIYHAVPMIVFPLYSDQYDTGAKVESHGIGIVIDKFNLTEDTIYSALSEIMTRFSYKNNIQRLSAMFRDKPMTPVDKAVYWIDHVLQHGGNQYRIPYEDLKLVERNLIDVLFFIVIILVFSLFVLMTFAKFLFTTTFHLISDFPKVKYE